MGYKDTVMGGTLAVGCRRYPPDAACIRRGHVPDLLALVPQCYTLEVLPRGSRPRAPRSGDYGHVCHRASRCLPHSGKIFFFTFPDARIMLRHVMDCSYNRTVIFVDRYLHRCRRGAAIVRGASRGQPAACGQEGVSEWPTTPRTALH